MNISNELKIGGAIAIIFLLIVSFSMFGKDEGVKPTINKTLSSKSVSPTPANSSSTYTLSDVSNHSSQNDCWIVINNKVYNATDYLSVHPGGADAIIPYCGADATNAFRGMMKHDSRADADLATILIGTVK